MGDHVDGIDQRDVSLLHSGTNQQIHRRHTTG